MGLLFLIFGVLAIAASTAFYFLPAIIAAARRARHFAGIFIVDLLFGWTVIGWLGTLLWAFTDEPGLATARVPCPFCAEAILPAAKVCPHCRRDLPESFITAQAERNCDYQAVWRRNPIGSLIVLLIIIVLVVSAFYYRHVRFEQNSPTFIRFSPMVVTQAAREHDEAFAFAGLAILNARSHPARLDPNRVAFKLNRRWSICVGPAERGRASAPCGRQHLPREEVVHAGADAQCVG